MKLSLLCRFVCFVCSVCQAVAIASKEAGKVVQRKRSRWSSGPMALSWSRV